MAPPSAHLKPSQLAARGHTDLLRHVGRARCSAACMHAAAQHGHLDTVAHCKTWGAPAGDAAFVAARYGHTDIVALCLTWGATPYARLMACAARGGHTALVVWCRRSGALVDFDWAARCAAAGGHTALAEQCGAWGDLARAERICADTLPVRMGLPCALPF